MPGCPILRKPYREGWDVKSPLAMPTLTVPEIACLLTPYIAVPLAPDALERLQTYLDLLLKWNAKTNLTAIRDPEQIVQRHFGESLFAAEQIGSTWNTLLDFGSGPGFPGLPIQILYPEKFILLAESQNKKAGFLREAARSLNLPTEVWPARVDTLPADRLFDIITLRAVDNMERALTEAATRLTPDGKLAILTTATVVAELPGLLATFPIPNTTDGVLALTVPRGTL